VRPDFTDVLYARFRKDILDGVFSPGTMLLETALSSRYGASRTPVREALGRLAQEGLTERTGRGFQVRRRSPEEIPGIFEARIALETRIAELAAERRSDFDLARMAHLAGQRQNATDPAQRDELDASWHNAVRLSAHNATMSDLLRRVDSLLVLYRPRTPTLPPDDQPAGEHEIILEAISRNDSAAAGFAMAGHLRSVRDLLIQAFSPDEAQPGGHPG
jgi:DNA-binding GntR family transcriptional regulator